MKDCTQEKLERIKKIKKKIVSNFPIPVSYEKTVIWIELNIGLSKRKAQEYLDAIISGSDWIFEDGVIKPYEGKPEC